MLKQVTFSGNVDYYPFGMVTPGRSYSAGSGYRFGFNGQEQVDEVYGSGNLNTAKYWEYDSRIGRRWNLDPVVYFTVSGYSTLLNNPLTNNDIEGDCPNGDCKDQQLVEANKIVDKHFNAEHNLTDISSLLEESISELDKTVIYGPEGTANLFEFTVTQNGDISITYPELETFKDLVYDIWVDRFVLDYFNNTSFDNKIASASTDALRANSIADRHFTAESLVMLWNITHISLFDLNFGIGSISKMPTVGFGNSRINTRLPYSDPYRRWTNVGNKVSQQKMKSHGHLPNEPNSTQSQKSYMLSIDDAQKVVDAYHANQATVLRVVERNIVDVQYNGVTGYYTNPGANISATSSNIFRIKGGPGMVTVHPLNPVTKK